jgi:AAA ATPase domain
MRVTSPKIVGREAELAALRHAVVAASRGAGSFWCVVGDAGLGKSRLAAELRSAASEAGVLVAHGSAIEGVRTPYRPLTEALLLACPDGPPEVPAVRMFRPALAQVLPTWSQESTEQASAVVVGEGVRRLLVHTAGDAGCLLVVDDLHWADPETVAVLRYLRDHVADARVMVLSVGRPEAGSAWQRLVDVVARDGRVLRVEPLDDAEVRQLAVAALGTQDASADLLETLTAGAAGSPFLVEELLTAWRQGDVVLPRSGERPGDAAGRTRVPEGFASYVGRRTERLGAQAREVLVAAALTDLQVPAAELSVALGADPDDVGSALDEGRRLGLLRMQDGRLEFTHDLTRTAVLAAAGDGAQARVARCLLESLTGGGRGAGLLGPHELAELALVAHDEPRALALLVESGVRDRARGALLTSREHLDRALQLATPPQRAKVAEELAHTLLQGGHPVSARRVLDALGPAVAAEPAEVRARLHLLAARAAVAAGDRGTAEDRLVLAEALADRDTGSVSAQVELLRAAIALAENRSAEARDLARRAAAEAEGAGDDQTVCEALELLARALRGSEVAESRSTMVALVERAEQAGLPFWVLRGLYQLGTLDLLDRSDDARLQRARQEAERSGALAMLAELQLEITACLEARFRHAEAREAAEACIEAGTVLGLRPVVAKAWVFSGVMSAKEGDRRQVEASCAAATAADDSTETVGAVWADCRALLDLAQERRESALAKLDKAVESYGGTPAVIPRPAMTLRHLLLSIDGQDPAPPASWGATAHLHTARGILAFAEAVRHGRGGDPAAARACFEAGDRALAPAPWHRHLARRCWPRQPAATAGPTRRPGCWRRPASSTVPATTRSPGHAARCCVGRATTSRDRARRPDFPSTCAAPA